MYRQRVLTAAEIEEAFSAGYELRSLEVKAPGVRTDNYFFAKISRAALSMGNLRDGGHVIIGIEDDNLAAMLPGLSRPALNSWLAYDDVARKLSEYADPPLRFDINEVSLSNGVTVIAIQVFEFDDIPHLCAKDFEKVLRKGALYTRPRKVPETSEIASSIEMRDVLQLASEKALRAYVETAERAGLRLVGQPPMPTSGGQYDAQRNHAWTSNDVIERIRSMGYWDATIRPHRFGPDRIPYDRLDDVLNAVVVRMRGWPVPFIDYREPLLLGQDWIGPDIDGRLMSHDEAWRFFTSGQFNHLRVVSADRRAGSESADIPAGFDRVLEVWEILLYLTEVFELSARLALSAAAGDTTTIDVRLHGMCGRGLIVGSGRRREFFEPHRATTDVITQQVTLPRDMLVAEPRRLAVDMAREMFLRFGWKPSTEQLSEHQQELVDGR